MGRYFLNTDPGMKLFGLLLGLVASELAEDPTKRLDRLVSQVSALIQTHYVDLGERFMTKAVMKAEDFSKQLAGDWHKKMNKCKITVEDVVDEDYEEETPDERADMADPCKAADQLMKSFARFARRHLKPCGKNLGKEPRFAQRMTSKSQRFAKMLKRKARC